VQGDHDEGPVDGGSATGRILQHFLGLLQVHHSLVEELLMDALASLLVEGVDLMGEMG
jgi:hypothetical protein